MLKDKRYIENNIKKLVQEGKPREQAIAIALDNAGISKDFNLENTRKEIERKQKGGSMKDKEGRRWPGLK